MKLKQLELYVGDVAIPLRDQFILLEDIGTDRVLSLEVDVTVIPELTDAWQRVVHSAAALRGQRSSCDVTPGRAVTFTESTSVGTDSEKRVSYSNVAHSNVLYLNADLYGARTTDVRYADVQYLSVQYSDVSYAELSQRSLSAVGNVGSAGRSSGIPLTITGEAIDARRVVICLADIVGLEVSIKSPDVTSALLLLTFPADLGLSELLKLIEGTPLTPREKLE